VTANPRSHRRGQEFARIIGGVERKIHLPKGESAWPAYGRWEETAAMFALSINARKGGAMEGACAPRNCNNRDDPGGFRIGNLFAFVALLRR
jgi:hypothetical protein